MSAVAIPGPARRVVTASALSGLSDGIWLTALPLLAAASTKSPLLVAAVFAVGQVPWLMLGVWAGGLVDRSDQRRLARDVAAIRTVLVFVLAVLVLVDAARIELILVVAFVVGIGEVLADTANDCLIPMLVAPRDLELANSRLVAAQITGNELAGPAVGGVLFAIGASLPFFTNAGLLAGALVVLAGLPLLVGARSGGDTVRTERARDGVVLVRGHPLLRTLTWSSAVLAAVDAGWFALLVLFVQRDLGLSSSAFGLLLAVGAVGGLAGAWLADAIGSADLAAVSAIVFVSMGVSLLGLAALPNPAMTAAALVVTSGAFALWNVYVSSARQRATPSDLLGRVGAAYRTLVVGAAIAGAMIGGVIASAGSLRIALCVAGLVVLAATAPVVRALRHHTVDG